MWLTRLALRNPVLILMVSLMTVVLGFVSLRRLSVDLFPDITIPVIRVATFYPGAGPADIEQTITQPIERAVAASPGIDRVESISRQGVSIVSVWFNFGTNLDNAQFEVSQRVAQILSSLPPGLQQPFVLKFDISNIPVAAVAVSGDGMDERQIYDLAYNTIEPQLERIPGVASASVSGGKVREITVAAHADALRARNMDVLDVVEAVRRSNLLLPSGNLKAGDRDYNVFANTQVAEAKPLQDVVVRAGNAAGGAGRNAATVRVRDVASVVDGAADQSEIVRINQQRGVYMRVLKQPGANTIGVVDAIRAEMPKMRGLPPGVKLAISFDQSTYVRSAVSSLEHEAVQGGFFAVLVILIFLVSVRATGIIAVAIPLSVVATFILLYFSGQTLNVFTLGGLALAVGRLVDDSIVELENIHRHLGMGQNRKQAILAAAQEVAMPILVSTITTIVVFFPVLFLRGVAQNLFLPLALTISFSLIVSFFVSRTVTPLLCLYALKAHAGGDAGDKDKTGRGIGGRITRGLNRLDDGYAAALAWVLRRRGRVVIVIFVLFVGSLQLKRGIGSEFFPDTDESQFTLSLKAPVGLRVEKTEEIVARIEKTIERTLSVPSKSASPGAATPAASNQAAGPVQGAGAETPSPSAALGVYYSTILSDSGLPGGRTALFTSNTGPHTSNIQVNLLPRLQRPMSDVAAAEKVRAALRDTLPGVQLYFFIGGIVKRILNFGAPAPIDIEILGHDLDAGSSYAKQVLARARDLRDAGGRPLLTDVQITREENYPEMDIEVDREKAGVLGLSEQQVAQNVLASLVGSTQFAPVPFTDAKTGNEYFVNVRMADRFRSHVTDLAEMFVRAPNGSIVALGNIARIRRSSGPVIINRKYLQRIVDVTANVAPGQDLGAASDAVESTLAALPPPEGFTVRVGGQTEEQRKAFADLSFAAVLAIVLVYMVLASQFRSLVDPLVIMFSVPLGIGGVFVMLYLTHTSLSVNSFMGIIMMVGIVVSNGVLLVDFANVLRRRGKPLIEATVEAARTRLRPILMTTVATVVGLSPMALGLGEGSEANMPLARAVIGGLSVSTVFTLFLVPTLYTLLDRFARRPLDDDDAAVGASGGHAAPNLAPESAGHA
jgi:multidrug efflux pump subunit AcrB